MARAYGSTAKLAIEAARLVPFVEMCEIRLELDYARLDGFTRELTKLNGQMLDKQFGERVIVVARLPFNEAKGLQSRFSKEILNF